MTSSLPAVDRIIIATGSLMPSFRHDGRLSVAERLPAMYYDIIALRPRWPIFSPPPQLAVIKRVRALGLWSVCRLVGNFHSLRFERRRGQRAGVHVNLVWKFQSLLVTDQSLFRFQLKCLIDIAQHNSVGLCQC